jgi:hypothetical protein
LKGIWLWKTFGVFNNSTGQLFLYKKTLLHRRFTRNVSPLLISEKDYPFQIENGQIFIYLLFYVAYKYHILFWNFLDYLMLLMSIYLSIYLKPGTQNVTVWPACNKLPVSIYLSIYLSIYISIYLGPGIQNVAVWPACNKLLVSIYPLVLTDQIDLIEKR